MDWLLPYLFFFMSAYAVIANDSIQTLGTWMVSNKKVKWYWLATYASFGLILTIGLGWLINGGDISYGRLEKIPLRPITWVYGLAPVALIILTRLSVPVSTSFLILSTFASQEVFTDMVVKSVVGYGFAAVLAIVLWQILARLMDERKKVSKQNEKYWRIAQWVSTGFLWWSWLTHDVANIAVFLPRNISWVSLTLSLLFFTFAIFFIFRENGGSIQRVVINKTGTKYVRSATLIDFVFALILVFFKELSSIPMSTTWVFIGLLSGRELSISWVTHERDFKTVFPIIRQDFTKLVIGMGVSVFVAWLVNQVK